jgi:hypothetical protein
MRRRWAGSRRPGTRPWNRCGTAPAAPRRSAASSSSPRPPDAGAPRRRVETRGPAGGRRRDPWMGRCAHRGRGERRQRLRQGVGRAGALVAVLVHRPGHRLGDAGRQARNHRRQRRARAVEDPRHQVLERPPVEGEGAGQGAVHHDAERVQIHAAIDVLLPAQLLRRHVVGRAERAAALGDRLGRRADRLGDAEVDQLHHVLVVGHVGQEDVLRLEVAVHDTARVGVGEGLEHVEHDRNQLAVGDPLARGLLDARGQRLALQELHHQEGDAVLPDAEVENLDDVGMLDASRRPRLALEAPDDLGIGRVGGEQAFDGDTPVDVERARVVDRPDAADGNQAVETVAAPEHRDADDVLRGRADHHLFGVFEAAGLARLHRQHGPSLPRCAPPGATRPRGTARNPPARGWVPRLRRWFMVAFRDDAVRAAVPRAQQHRTAAVACGDRSK